MTLASIAFAFPAGVRAQQSLDAHSARSGASRAPDTTADENDGEANAWRLRTGVSTGSLRYQGGRTESAAALLLKLAFGDQLSIGVTPTFAHVSYPATSGSSSGNVSGLTDIPVGIGLQHSFGGRFEPNLGLSVGSSIPVGDTAKGLGSGSVGSSFDVSAGFSPMPGLGVSAGVGHSFSDFSVRSALNGTASGWADLSAWGDVTDRLSVSAGYDRDIGPVDTAFGRSSSLSGGLSYNLFKSTNVGISAAHGLTGVSPLWSFSIGVGTAIPSIAGGFHKAVDQLSSAFGGGNHGLSKKGSGGTGGTTAASRRRGRKKIGT